MDEKQLNMIRRLGTLEELASLEENFHKKDALTSEVRDAIRARSTELGKALITRRTGLSVENLTPAESKIVEAVSEYVGVMKRQGKDASRTFLQLKNRGFIEAAEASVMKSKPTQGYKALAEANLEDLSYEQIIIDHPDEFSARATWYARRTLGLPNTTTVAPAKSVSTIQTRTEELLRWWQDRSRANNGLIPSFTNTEAASVIGMGDMSRFGRPYGNIQSRIDFACYRSNLPPLGLAADTPFAEAWSTSGRTWSFPIPSMQSAARTHVWTDADFASILRVTEGLPGQAYIFWQGEPEHLFKAWALGL